MKITIVQSEIETAIAEYIASKGLVIENMDVDVDLRATRGDEGFQAFIDISPKSGGTKKGKPSPAPTPTPNTAQSSSEPLGIVAAAKGKRTPKAETPAEPKAEKAEEEAPVESTTQDEAPVVENETETVAEVQAEPQVEPEVEVKKETKSIFGSLTKPVNA